MLLQVSDLLALLEVSRSTLYEMMNSRDFPRPIKLSPGRTGAVRWDRAEVYAWIDARKAERV